MSGHADAPDLVPDQSAQGHGSRGQRPLAGRHRRVRPDHIARAGRSGRDCHGATDRRRGDHQRPRPAVPAVRAGCSDAGVVPCRPADARSRIVRRRDVVRREGVLRAERGSHRDARSGRFRPMCDRRAGRVAGYHQGQPQPGLPGPEQTRRYDQEGGFMRVYVPSTLRQLSVPCNAGEIGPAPLTVYAVTPALREWYVDGDDEELEYAAMAQAARASVGLLAADPAIARRRVVIAAEVSAVPPADGSVELGDARLELRVVVPWTSVAAVHVDAVDATPLVGKAADLWEAAQNGDDDAVFALDLCEGEDLLWYATQEIPDLLAAEGPRGGQRT